MPFLEKEDAYFLIIKELILFFQHSINQGNIVFLLRKYIVHQMNSFLH